jgi:hypothetical protein
MVKIVHRIRADGRNAVEVSAGNGYLVTMQADPQRTRRISA